MTSFHIKDAILHHDEDVVVMNKPPNALCVPGRYIKDSLVVRVAEHLNVKVSQAPRGMGGRGG